MAELAVSILIGELSSILVNEVNLLGGLGREVSNMKDELEIMRAFLQDADRQQDNDKNVKVWVKQIREIAYDIEDIMDEFLHHVGHPSLERRDLAGFFHGIVGFAVDLRARRQIATQLQEIKLRLDTASDRKFRFFLTSNITSEEFSGKSTYFDTRLVAPLLTKEADLVGIQQPKDEIIGRLVGGGSRLEVITMVGMAGSGKTTIVRKVYEDQMIRLHFPAHDWITVSQSYNIEELLSRLIRAFDSRATEEIKASFQDINIMSYLQLAETLDSFLMQKRYVVFLDDVWSIEDWERLRPALPENGCGSRIIITTRSLDVAKYCARPSENKYELQPLKKEDSWALFCNKTFASTSRGTSICPPELEECSRKLLKICKGLTLAIVTMAGLLSTKNRTLADWEGVYQSLGAEIESSERFNSMNRILWLSYEDLPYYLKPCFLYLAAFPKARRIRRSALTRKWIAENMVRPVEGMNLEEVSNMYINQLLCRSLIEVTPSNMDGHRSIYGFQVHDLLHELIITKSKEQNFVTFTRGGLQEQSHNKARRLTIDWGHSFPVGIDTSRVPSLTSKRENICFSKLKMLKVLSLEDVSLESFPDEVVNLFHLRYLSLRWTKIKVIPNSIGKLKNLQTLDLKWTVPIGINQCPRLQYLVASILASKYVSKGVTMPTRIGALASLQKLRYMELKGDLKQVEEMGKLTQLRKLSLLNIESVDMNVLSLSMLKLSNLKSLALLSRDRGEPLNLESISPVFKQLASLRLYGGLKSLEDIVSTFGRIGKIQLGLSGLGRDPFQTLQHLPHLVDLRLFRLSYTGKVLFCQASGFPKLRLLVLRSLKNLRFVHIMVGAMPNLVRLEIGTCAGLGTAPTGIEHLYSIKVLVLLRMPIRFVERVQRDTGADWDKVKHIPVFLYTHCCETPFVP